MSSKSIYCVYLTIYRGNKLPPFYIGSSSVDKVNNGYNGSVRSKKFTGIWKEEQKNNKHLFITKIISTHAKRKEATEFECKIQKKLDVIKNPLYINLAIASRNGFFGFDVSGKNNPMHKSNYDYSNEKESIRRGKQKKTFSERKKLENKLSYSRKKSKEECNKISEKKSNRPRTQAERDVFELCRGKNVYVDNEGNRYYISTKDTRVISGELKSLFSKPHIRCCCLICGVEIGINNISKHSKTHY